MNTKLKDALELRTLVESKNEKLLYTYLDYLQNRIRDLDLQLHHIHSACENTMQHN